MSDSSDIGLEMLNIDRIETYDSHVQANIRFCEFGPEEVFPRGFGEHLFETIERFEQWEDIILVSLLGSCEAAFVDSIVSIKYRGRTRC